MEIICPTRGYIYDPDIPSYDEEVSKTEPVQVNEMGTRGILPPLKANPNIRSVMVFGGSVAEDLAYDLDRGKALEEALTQLSNGKKVIVSNGAVSGYKQPEDYQSLLDFVSRGYHLDDMVHLAGLNDVGLFPTENLTNGVDYRYPWRWISRVYRPGDYLERIILAHNFSFSLLDTSAIANLMWKGLDDRLTENRAKVQAKKRNFMRDGHTNPFHFTNDMTKEERQKQEDIIFRCLAENYSFYVERMNSLCLDTGIKPHFFLQPSQYADPSLLDTEANKEMIIPNFIFGYGPRKGYPYLRKEMKKLEKKGIHVVDLTAIYKNVHQQVYADVCCHANMTGNQILAEEIAKKMKE